MHNRPYRKARMLSLLKIRNLALVVRWRAAGGLFIDACPGVAGIVGSVDFAADLS